MVRWFGLLLLGLLGQPLCGQEGELRPVELPPLVLGNAPEVQELPTGKPVSRPLQPVSLEASPPTRPFLQQVDSRSYSGLEQAETDPIRPLGRNWESIEYLLWWPKGGSLPPLLVGNRGPDTPVLGGPTTQTLIGGRSLSLPDVSGGRLKLGVSVNETESAGLSASYFFLGSRTVSVAYSDLGQPRVPLLARPLRDSRTGYEEIVPVSIPGQLQGRLEASATLRAAGWELNGLANLSASPTLRLNAIVGYRYFQLDEGLRVDQYALMPERVGFPAVLGTSSDQFDTHNRFHGGQLGFQADFTRGSLFMEATGKVALGQVTGVVHVSGQTVALAGGWPWTVEHFPGGVLGQPSNTGRITRSGFAVLPEAAVKLGYRFRDRSRFYVGYNFIYLSEVLRPADQIDRTVDLGVVPLFPRAQVGVLGGDRPAILLSSSDFWAQGLSFGLEYRY